MTDTDKFNHFITVFFGEQLNDEQKAALWKDGNAMTEVKKSLKTVFDHAKSSLAVAPQSDAPLCIISPCKEASVEKIGWIKELASTWGADQLYEKYPQTSECEAHITEMPGTINMSGIWATLQKKDFTKFLEQIPTPQQIDEIIPHLRTRNPDLECSYIIPVKSYDCLPDYREEMKNKPDAIGNTILFLGIKVCKTENKLAAPNRSIEWSVYAELDLGDMSIIVMPAENDARQNYAVILVR